MKKNIVAVSTGNICSCTGNIVETFSIHYGQSNGIIGPGAHAPRWPQSDGFECDKCGLVYKNQVYKGVEKRPLEEIEFELKLSVAKLTRAITIDDLEPISYFKHSRKRMKQIGNVMVPVQTLSWATKKWKSVPKELKKLKPGDTVYMIPSDGHDPHNRYGHYILEKKRTAKSYPILYTCFT